MRRESMRGCLILLLVALVQFCLGFYTLEISELARFSSPFQIDIASSLADSIVACTAVLLFKSLCPELYKKGKDILLAKRSASFWSFLGIRKFIVLSALAIFFITAGGLLTAVQIEFFGVHNNTLGFEPTARYAAASEGEAGQGDMQVATGKKILGRFASAASEELVFRWFSVLLVLGLLGSEFKAIGISSLFFGIVHFFGRMHEPSLADQLVLVLPSAFAGIMFGILFLRLGLWASVLFHTMTNLIPAFRQEAPATVVLIFFALVIFLLTPAVMIETIYKKVFRRSA